MSVASKTLSLESNPKTLSGTPVGLRGGMFDGRCRCLCDRRSPHRAAGWIAHPRAGSHGPQRSLVASAAAKRLVVLHWRWTNGAAARPEPVAAEGLAVLWKQSVHAALHHVAARR